MDKLKSHLINFSTSLPFAGSKNNALSTLSARDGREEELISSSKVLVRGSIHPLLPQQFSTPFVTCSLHSFSQPRGGATRYTLTIGKITIEILPSMQMKPLYQALEQLLSHSRRRDSRTRSLSRHSSGSISSELDKGEDLVPATTGVAVADIDWVVGLMNKEHKYVELKFQTEHVFVRWRAKLADIICDLVLHQSLRLTKEGNISLKKLEQAIDKALTLFSSSILSESTSQTNSPIKSSGHLIPSPSAQPACLPLLTHCLKIHHLKRDLHEVIHQLSLNIYSISKEELQHFILRVEDEPVRFSFFHRSSSLTCATSSLLVVT